MFGHDVDRLVSYGAQHTARMHTLEHPTSVSAQFARIWLYRSQEFQCPSPIQNAHGNCHDNLIFEGLDDMHVNVFFGEDIHR